jgi:hypothetical protein
MICTSSHGRCIRTKYKTYAISGNRGKDANYYGECYPKLAPKLSFWKIWHDNIGKISEEENNRYYVSEYYKQVLSKLDPEEVYRELDNSILLCYEPITKFCHRHIVAAWFELFLDVDVPEVNVSNNEIELVERPSYIKEYLVDAIKQNNDMKGFNSVRALYLYEQGDKLEKQADILEETTGTSYSDCRQFARTLKREATIIEKRNTK